MLNHSLSFIVWLISLIPLYLVQLWISPLFLKIGTNILLLHSSGILFDRKMLLNNLVSHTIATSPRHLHTSIGMLSGPNALPTFILFKASFTWDSWILRTNRRLVSSKESSSSIMVLSFSPLNKLSEVLSPSVLYLIIFHQMSVSLVFDAFNLGEVSRLPLSKCCHLIDVLFAVLRAQLLI